MARPSPSYRYRTAPAFATPVKAPKKRLRRVRRLLIVLGVLVVLLLIALTYVLHAYAPGLRAEARTIPARVQEQLSQHGAAYLPLSQISLDLQNAIVAIEDRRFYSHPGVDPLGTIRALWVNLTNGRIDQGGSTLEEQLVKRAIVHDDSSIHNKLRTMALAWAVDREFSKRKILELYLNAAYYGQGAYGVGEAARVYFGTDPLHLSLAQAAFLAALPQAPSIYGAHPLSAAVVDRQRTVLSDMRSQGYISAAQEQEAKQTHLAFSFPNP
jgi:penicillin-binding protein 1A